MTNKPSHKLADVLERVPEIPISDAGQVELSNLKAVYTIATIMHASGWVPKGLNLEQTAICVLQASRLRVDPFIAINHTAVINGRPTFYGDFPLGLCQNRAGIRVDEWFELNGKRVARRPSFDTLKDYPGNFAAVCAVLDREGKTLTEEPFSVHDARTAKLWGKTGPWTEYPFRMLTFRARAFALRRACPEVMMGLDVYEEFVGPATVVAEESKPVIDMKPKMEEVKGTPEPEEERATVLSMEDARPKEEPEDAGGKELQGAPKPNFAPEPKPEPGPQDAPGPVTEAQLQRFAKLVKDPKAAGIARDWLDSQFPSGTKFKDVDEDAADELLSDVEAAL